MTVSSTSRLAEFVGNGYSYAFPFNFMVFSAGDLSVVKTDTSTGVEQTLVLNSDYSVTLNLNQVNNPGGTVTFLAGAVLPVGYTLDITSAVPNLQPTEFTNSGGFYPEVLTTSLDRLTILIQQIQQAIDSLPKRLAVWPCDATTPGTVYTAPAPVVAVFVRGILQRASDYSVVGPVITFNFTVDPEDNVNALCANF